MSANLHSVLLSIAPLLLLQSEARAERVEWRRVQTTTLELLTTADAASAADALNELESLRLYILSALPAEATAAARLRIVAFSSEWEFQAFRLNAHSPAYFVGGPAQPTIVLGRLSKDSLPSLRHELVHYLLRLSRRDLPLWLEEGLAESLSGVDPATARARLRLLRQNGPIPIDEFLAAGRDSRWYTSYEGARLFYAQSWALVESMRRNSPSLDWAAIDRWLRHPGPLDLDLQPAPRPELPRLQSTALIDTPRNSDIDLALGRLLLTLGDLEGARVRLERAADEQPEAWAALGDAALRQSRPADARSALRRALSLHAADARALWQLAVLEQNHPQGDPATAVRALELLLAAAPSNDQARIALSSHYLRLQRFSDALAQLHMVRQTPPAQAAYFKQALQFAQANAAPPALR